VASVRVGGPYRGGLARRAALPPHRLGGLPALGIVVGTNGSTAAIERARTAIEVAFPDLAAPATVRQTQGGRLLAQWQQLAEVVILASLPIAGCSLAVSVATSLTDRKRPFSLLRLTGVPLRLLRGVLALETAVPLVAVAVLSAGLGLLTAELFLRSQLGLTLLPPGPGYYASILGRLALSLAIIAATFPLLNRITGPETARNE